MDLNYVLSRIDVDQCEKESNDQFLVILYNLLCSLNYLHSVNVMHRDMKPSNILVTDDCMIKICDFGLSRGVIDDDLSKTLTKGESLKSNNI